jgi:hypothetical protein
MTFTLTHGHIAIEAECADEQFSRENVALTYALAMRGDDSTTDWSRANKAIADRWGMRGLEDVKEQAWALIEARAR